MLALTPVMAAPPEVRLLGVMGDRALIGIDGAKPRLMRAGDRVAGVELISIEAQSVRVRREGAERSIALGGRLQTRPDPAESGAQTASLHADLRGHFLTTASVNGVPLTFLLDTGASVVALTGESARRAGVRLENAEATQVQTANGTATAWRVHLNSIQLGAIRLNMVEAVVIDSPLLPANLLGMSFLHRTDMHREGDLLTLIRRY